MVVDMRKDVAVVVAAKVTSRELCASGQGWCIPIIDWDARGLRKPSCIRLDQKFESAFERLLRDLSVPFENNGSERLLRKAKGKLKQSGGFRSTPNGEQSYCDFLTIVETAKMRGIQPYRAVHATFAGEGGLFA